MGQYESIVVSHDNEDTKVTVMANPNNYKLLGLGFQGAVFELSKTKCVKIYPHSYSRNLEEDILKDVQKSEFFPKIYETGNKYIVMENIHGTPLDNYLKNTRELPEWIIYKLLHLLTEMKKFHFTRIDVKLRHVLILEEEKKVKVIDHVNSRQKVTPYPKNLLKGLEKMGFLATFIQKVKKIDKTIYDEWKKQGAL
ncbi:serine/threonine protein kinase [Halalkalibacter kiskunsagensis]|uniref:Serine/threonine protein kinase n=1 Tax=Halalkalibacter kiskunsagensis TaxID=1548599 RepID=A0ABV6KCC6_9BACI